MAAKLTQEEKYMKAAIREAKKAWALGEVPMSRFQRLMFLYKLKLLIFLENYKKKMVLHTYL